MKACRIAAGAALSLCIGAVLAAPAESVRHPSTKTAVSGTGGYTAKTERGQLAQQIVRKWSGYVQNVYGTTPMAWAKAMGSTFAQADMGNLRAAVKFQTYEAMSASLLGQKASDEKVINALAKDASLANIKTLGSPANDMVYTMIDPCRIVDTRLAVGALTANIARNFISDGASFAVQGGAASTCNIPADPSALVLNVTVLGPAGGPSHIRLYPYGTPIPNTVAVNYTAGQRISNEVIVKMTPGQPFNFSAISGFATDIVIDVAGYFMAPEATALDCTTAYETPTTRSLPANANTYYYTTAACPAGYSVSSANCWNTGASGVYSGGSGINGGAWCHFVNTTAAAQAVRVGATCCRVPGR